MDEHGLSLFLFLSFDRCVQLSRRPARLKHASCFSFLRRQGATTTQQTQLFTFFILSIIFIIIIIIISIWFIIIIIWFFIWFEFFAALERKMSMRAHRDELIQKGILLPDLANSTTSSTNASNTLSTIAGKDENQI